MLWISHSSICLLKWGQKGQIKTGANISLFTQNYFAPAVSDAHLRRLRRCLRSSKKKHLSSSGQNIFHNCTRIKIFRNSLFQNGNKIASFRHHFTRCCKTRLKIYINLLGLTRVFNMGVAAIWLVNKILQ